MLSLSDVDILRLFCYISSEFSMCKVNLLLAFLPCFVVCSAYTLLMLYNVHTFVLFVAANFVFTHAGIAAGVGRAFSRVCLSVCLSAL